MPRHRFAGFERAVMAMERKAAKGLFVECVCCGNREFRKWDRTLPPGGLSCCSRCDALPETESSPARPSVFPSLCDWLDPEAPAEWLGHLLGVIARTPHLDWMLLTKRPEMFQERMRAVGSVYSMSWCEDGGEPKNVWIGATVEGPEQLPRVSDLLRIPARTHFVSHGPVVGGPVTWPAEFLAMGKRALLVTEGESGPRARPMHPDVPRADRDQCVAAGVPFFFKQWGDNPHPEARVVYQDRANALMRLPRAGRMLDGREWNQMPDGKDGAE